MWNYLASFQNHFLQLEVKNLKPESINELVCKEFTKTQTKRVMCRVPYKPVPCPHSTYFKDRARLAYGWMALPKLMYELNSDKKEEQWRATNSLSEYIQNPLNAQTAINDMELVRKVQNLYLRIRYRNYDESFRQIARILVIFKIVTCHLNGADQVSLQPYLLREFYGIIYRRERHEDTVAKILRNLTEKPVVLQTLLNETTVFEYVRTIFAKDPCVPYYPKELWIHLGHFLEVAPEMGIEAGFFELIYRRILGRLPLFNVQTMKCFALLLRCEEGQRRFDDVDGVNLLYRIFLNARVISYKYVTLALTNGLCSKRALWRCREFPDFPKILLRYAQKVGKPILQLQCLKAIRMMCEMPCIKAYACDKVLPGLRSINCANKLNECTRDDLVDFLTHKIYETNIYHPWMLGQKPMTRCLVEGGDKHAAKHDAVSL